MSDAIHLYHMFFVQCTYNFHYATHYISNEHSSHTYLSHLFKFDPVTLDGGASWTGDMSLSAGDL